MNRPLKIFPCLLVTLFCAACGALSFVPRQHKVDALAQNAGWTERYISTSQFDLLSAIGPAEGAGRTLTIYIEGDGLAYLRPAIVSEDPTPLEPLALELALKQYEGRVAYLARPCQYATDRARNCKIEYWTSRRYSTDVIASMDEAVSTLKEECGATQIALIGYSGGGAVAVLLAARRRDVVGLVTVAGNLDLATWTRSESLSPLTGSLDPIGFVGAIRQIPQVHLTGSLDKIVDPFVTQSFFQRLPNHNMASLIDIAGYDHECCWIAGWAGILERPELRRILDGEAGAPSKR